MGSIFLRLGCIFMNFLGKKSLLSPLRRYTSETNESPPGQTPQKPGAFPQNSLTPGRFLSILPLAKRDFLIQAPTRLNGRNPGLAMTAGAGQEA
jgi:hypothetical protein